MSLPAFRYHPDPLATGSVIRSDARCVCCGDARGYVYAGPVYAVDEYENCLCPRCIAHGSAQPSVARTASAAANATKFPTRSSAKSLVARRAFRVGSRSAGERIAALPRSSSAVRVPENCARSARRQSRRFGPTGLDEGAEWEHCLAALDKDGSPTAYMFRCIRCGEPGGYQDCV